jgi:hypothetical protein
MLPRVDRAEGKLDGLVERVATTEEGVTHFPTKEMVVKIALGTIATIGVLVAFGEKIRGFLKWIIA